MSRLAEMVADRRVGVLEEQKQVPLAELASRCPRSSASRVSPVLARLASGRGRGRAIIAEVKRRSPSRGLLSPNLSPKALAVSYETAGAAAISVLVEPTYFGGSISDLRAVVKSVRLPVLYKDFVVDPYQLYQARANGAAMVLLMVSVLGQQTAEFIELAVMLGLEPLVEVHTNEELELALRTGARMVGVNNRNLRTLETDLDVCRTLLPRVPKEVLAVAESGLQSAQEIQEMAALGARAFLVGEALVTSPDPAAILRELSSATPAGARG